MKNMLNYLVANSKKKNYVVSIETELNENKLNTKELTIKEINKFTNYLHKQKISNKKIGLLIENSNNFVKAFYGILLKSKIPVSINNKVDIEELKDIIKKNKLDLIITGDKNYDSLKKLDIELLNIDKLNLEEYNDELDFIPKEKSNEDIFVISYTSGTSSSYSKGVELTYGNITFVSEEYKKVYHLNKESQIITVLPLWHNYSMFACLTSSIVAKSTLIIMKEWDARLFIEINKDLKPSVFPGSPYMYIDLINNYNDELTKLDNLKVCDSGGDSLPIECINKFEKMTGAVITEGYGLTETASLTHFNYSAHERKVGSLGKTVSKTYCKILDLNGKKVKDGEWGLLWIKGPMVFKDYVSLPGASDLVKKNGWFNTNDVVRKDNDGYYFIAGRFSDLKSLNGDDNQLRTLENLLYKFEGIKRVHIKTNFNSLASFYFFDIVAILKDNYSIQDLYDYINSNLKQFVIGDVKIVDTLPTTGTGKIKRNKINDLFNIDLSKYKKKELSGGLRCKTYLLNGEEKYIYQEYYDNTMYQAKKKYDITNIIQNKIETSFIPKALSYGIEKDKTWLLTEYKSGDTLEQVRKDKNFKLNLIAKDLAKTLYLVHNSSNYSKYGWITDKEVFENDTFAGYLQNELERFNEAVKSSVDDKSLKKMLDEGKRVIKIIKNYEKDLKPCLLWFDLNPNNIIIDKNNENYKLSAVVDAGGAKYGIKEWDLAFLRMETCVNEDEFQSILKEYKKLDNSINEELIKDLCIFIELDDMIIRILDKVIIRKPYDTNFDKIIDKIQGE